MVKRSLHLLAILTLLCGCLACEAQNHSQDDQVKIIELSIEKSPSQNEALRAILHVGILPANTSLVVKDTDDNVVGSAQPYGIPPGNKAGKFIIPVPSNLIKNRKVKLHITLKGKDTRAPTDKELEKVEIVIIDITP